MNLLEVVALIEGLPDEALKRGQVGTIVEILHEDIFEVEFSVTQGQPYALIPLHNQQLMQLHYAPAQK